MKKTLLFTAAALMLSAGAFAQEYSGQRPQRGERPDEATMIKMRTERMAKEYGLNEAQTAKLLELNQKYPNVMGPGMRGPGGSGMGRPRDGQRPDGENVGSKSDDSKAAAKKAKKSKKNKKSDGDESDTQARPEGGKPGVPPGMTEERMKEMEAAREAYETELKGILTEAQFKTYQENKNRRPQGRGPGGPRN